MTKLELQNHGVLDTDKNVPIALTYDLNDIKDLKTRGGVWSKTVKLPGTANNNTIFEAVFNVNQQSLTFNRNVKEPIRVIVDGVTIFEGVFQLRKINKKYTTVENFDLEYDCYIKSEVSTFYTELGGKYLHDLKTEKILLHNQANIVDSLEGTLDWTKVYQYWFTSTTQPNYNIRRSLDFNPAIYAKWYLGKICEDAGFSYEFDEEYDLNFHKMIVPYNGAAFSIKNDAGRTFRAGKTVQQEHVFFSQILIDPVDYYPDAGVVPFENTTTAPWFDDTDNYPTILSGIPDSQYSYKIGYVADITLTSRYNVKIAVTTNGIPGSDYLRLSEDLSMSFTNILQADDTSSGYQDIVASTTHDVIIENSDLFSIPAGDHTDYTLVEFSINTEGTFVHNQPSTNPYDYITNQLTAVVNSQSTVFNTVDHTIIEVELKVIIEPQADSSARFYNKTEARLWNDTVIHLDDFIPKKILQSDFVLGLTRMFNLYITLDPINSQNLIIRTRDKFYEDGLELDWTKLIDTKTIDTEFISNKIKKRSLLTYKKDGKDVLIKEYVDETGDTPGQLEYINENDFINGVEKIEPVFSPTVLIDDHSYRLSYIDSRAPKNNIRILYLGDLIDEYWQYDHSLNFTDTTDYFAYRYAGHLYPNPTESTLDLNFGINDYYGHTFDTLTDNNLFNNHYRNQFDIFENGFIMTAKFNLSYADVQTIKLNERIYIHDSWWNINKIIDFDMNEAKLTKVELVTADATIGSFLPNNNVLGFNTKSSNIIRALNEKSINADNIVGAGTTATLMLGANNKTSDLQSTLISGNNNKVQGSNHLVIGDGNVVSGKGVTILGADNIGADQPGMTNISRGSAIIHFIDAGRDCVLGIGGDKPQNLINAGRDTVLDLGSTCIENVIDAGTDRVLFPGKE